MTHAMSPFVPDRRTGAVVARGLAWGAVAGAASGAASVVPPIMGNGPVVALVVYAPVAAVVGAVVGLVVGPIVGAALVAVAPATTTGARGVAAFTTALCLAWVPLPFGSPAVAGWLLLLCAVSGALVGPRISARRSGAGAAAGTASPGWSRAPGR